MEEITNQTPVLVPEEAPKEVEMKPKGNKFLTIFTSVFVIVVLLVAVFLVRSGGWKSTTSVGTPDPNLYQAVFLINNQVYFGKISKLSEGFITLDDIFYLQVVQPLQQLPEGQQSSTQPQMNLVKMGSEIHGPTNSMVIPMTSVVFWEDIKADGTVSKAITEYKNKPAQ